MDSTPDDRPARDADALGDLVARDRRSDDAALLAPGFDREYDYRRFCAMACRTGNLWRRRGVHADATVAVAADPVPEAVFAFLGAALLGARTRFGFPGAESAEGSEVEAKRALDTKARLVVGHRDEIESYDAPAGTRRVAWGGPPDDPAVVHFERAAWSENPAFPETPVDSDAVALVARDERDRPRDEGDRVYSHADLLTAAREVVDDWGLGPGDEVAVRASLARPGAVVAGVLAPLLAGAAVLFPDDDTEGTAAVVKDSLMTGVPESRTHTASEFA